LIDKAYALGCEKAKIIDTRTVIMGKMGSLEVPLWLSVLQQE
jgi:hypothetical protein